MTTDRDTGWRMYAGGVEFGRFYGLPKGLQLHPGGVNYVTHYWRDLASGRIVVTKNNARSTFTAHLDGRLVGQRFYTIQNAARAAVKMRNDIDAKKGATPC